jgi:cell division protein ZapB
VKLLTVRHLSLPVFRQLTAGLLFEPFGNLTLFYQSMAQRAVLNHFHLPGCLPSRWRGARFFLIVRAIHIYPWFRVPPLMLEASLNKLEALVGQLLEQNRQLVEANGKLSAELAQARDENDSLQLSLLEQEEQQGATAARIQALIERVSPEPVGEPVGEPVSA